MGSMTLPKQKILCTIAHSLSKSSRVLNPGHAWSTPLDISHPPLEIVFQDGSKEWKPAEKGHYGLTTKIALRKANGVCYFPQRWRAVSKSITSPIYVVDFLQGIIRRKLDSSAGKLGIHEDRPVSLFYTAGFSAAQVFFPSALGPYKDECWISLNITHRLICY